MSWTRLTNVALVVAIVAACGGEATGGSTTTVPPSTTTEGVDATTTSVPAPTTTTVAPTTTQTLDESASRLAWQLTASDHRGEVGTQYDFECPAPGFLNSVWGTDIYTDDSSVCSAAVHAGLITIGVGGTLTIEMRAGETSYAGSEANGVTSGDWGQWHSSYVFVE